MSEPRYHLSLGDLHLEDLTDQDVRAQLATASPVDAERALVWREGWPDWRPASSALSRPQVPLWLTAANFVKSLVAAVDAGHGFQRVARGLLVTAAIAYLVAGLVAWFLDWRTAFQPAIPTLGVVGAIVPQVISLVLLVATAYLLLLRSQSVSAEEGGRTPARTALAGLVRAWGDVLLIVWPGQAIARLLLVLAAGSDAPRIGHADVLGLLQRLLSGFPIWDAAYAGDWRLFVYIGYGEIVAKQTGQLVGILAICSVMWILCHAFAEFLESGRGPGRSET